MYPHDFSEATSGNHTPVLPGAGGSIFCNIARTGQSLQEVSCCKTSLQSQEL